MPDFSYDPPLPNGPTPGFVQTVRLMSAGKPIGYARWHVPGDASAGVVQLLELTVACERRRNHHGQQLWEAMLDQVRRYFKSRQVRPRRMWIALEQKEQVVGRAFLTRVGFHHVATIPSLLKEQDAMVYLLSLD